MSYQELPIDILLERVADMPDIEAEQELVLRKENFALEMAMLSAELSKLPPDKKNKKRTDIGYAIQVIGQDQFRMNAVLAAIRKRIEARKWSNAVMSVCGSEVWAQCREWMAAQDGAQT